MAVTSTSCHACRQLQEGHRKMKEKENEKESLGQKKHQQMTERSGSVQRIDAEIQKIG